MNGHFDNELWGMSTIPGTDEIVTCGQDMMVARWDTKAKKIKNIAKMPFQCTRCHTSADKKWTAIGCTNGCVIILDMDSFSAKHRIKDRSKQVSEVRFSPDSQLLAVAGFDNLIYIYLVP